MKIISQKIIADALGISQQFVSGLLNGKLTTSWKMAKRLSALTETDPIIWVEGDVDKIRAALSRFKTITILK